VVLLSEEGVASGIESVEESVGPVVEELSE
jgi:hypothetical protein